MCFWMRLMIISSAMAGQELSSMLIYAGGACFCLTYSMQALGTGK